MVVGSSLVAVTYNIKYNAIIKGQGVANLLNKIKSKIVAGYKFIIGFSNK